MDRDGRGGPSRPQQWWLEAERVLSRARMEITGDWRTGPGVEGAGPVEVLHSRGY